MIKRIGSSTYFREMNLSEFDKKTYKQMSRIIKAVLHSNKQDDYSFFLESQLNSNGYHLIFRSYGQNTTRPGVEIVHLEYRKNSLFSNNTLKFSDSIGSYLYELKTCEIIRFQYGIKLGKFIKQKNIPEQDIIDAFNNMLFEVI